MNDKKYSVAITGASGFLGSALIDKLKLSSQFSISAFTRAKHKNLNDPHLNIINISDICSHDWGDGLGGFDCIVHSAARVHVMNEDAKDALSEFRRVNVDATLRLARSAAAAGVKRFVFISSIKVNGEETHQGKPFFADDSPNPSDAYGVSKSEAERALMMLAESTEMEVVIIRPVLVYGPGVKANFLNLIKLANKGIPLPLRSIKNRRSLVCVDNLINLIEVCITHPKAAGQIFLVSDDHDLSTPELLTKVANALNKKIYLFSFPPKLLECMTFILGRKNIGHRLCRSLQVDISKTKEVLGWKPIVNPDQGIKKTIDFLMESSI